MKLSPKVISGILTSQNKGACDWGWQGQVAYGCNSCVVVVDPVTVQILQVLDKHKGTVVKVRWARENFHHDVGSPYALRLASGDANGSIIIWDVSQGEAKTEFSDGNKPIQGLEWLPWQDASHDLLVALHPPYSLILWNADTGTKLWKKSYTEPLNSFCLDPFNHKNMAFLGQDSILFIDDFSITKTPSSNGKKFYISSPSSAASKADSMTGSLERKTSTSSMSSRGLAKRMTRILVGEGKPRGDEEKIALNECVQLAYHRAYRHHIILVYPREILILDLEINQTVGIIQAERTGSPFMEILPMRQRDVLYCLHENGSITCRVRRRSNILPISVSEGNGGFEDSLPPVAQDVMYDLRCTSDSIRMTRHCKVIGAMCCPVSEKTLALILSDSRVITWEMTSIDFQSSKVCSANQGLQDSGTACPRLVLSDMIGQSQTLSPDSESAYRGQGMALKFIMTGLLSGITSPITVIRMCPPLTTKNWNIYEPILAVGNQTGSVQIVHLGSGQVDREYSLHTGPVRGLEWAGLRSFMSYSYLKPGMSGLVKNEILLVDIGSGKAEAVRTHKDQESPIEMLRISHLKQYFIITFKEKPLELWDLKTLTILREMSKNIPTPTALEWSPSHSLKALKRKLQLQQLQQTEQQQDLALVGGANKPVGGTTKPAGGATKPVGGATEKGGASSGGEGGETSSMESSTSQTLPTESTSSDPKSSTARLTVKEHFVYTDSDGTLYHFLVEGSGFKDASKIPPESGMGSITWISWKGDYLAFGDGDGQLCLWDLKAKTSRTNSTHRGWVKKIRFAPGRGNFKFLLLYNDGVDIWDINDGKPELLSSIKSPREIGKVVDAEWAGSDRPVLATLDGCIHMCDISLKKSVCPVEDRDLPEAVFSAYLLQPRASFLLKHLLQHQKWRPGYELELSGLRDEDKELEDTVNSSINFINTDLAEYLVHCKYGTAERCLLTARLYGDESEVQFWEVALHYMRSGKSQCISKSSSSVFAKAVNGDIFIPQIQGNRTIVSNLTGPSDAVDGRDEGRLSWKHDRDQPLEKCYDFLCDNNSYMKYQLDRVSLHDSKRVTYEHTRKCAETYIMLGQADRAVQLLLETESDNDMYYIDCLRSCLVASIRSSGASQSTIKLVATNLIASGKLQEGVQLLCLIDKGLDACRYLQTYGAWEQAVWLAKSSLDYEECCEVMKRWVEHLSSTHVNQKSTAILVMLSLGYFSKVIEMLYGARQFNRAACFIEAATEFGLLEKTEENSSLIEAVFLEYARQLSNLGHRQSAEYYCQQAGNKGKQLLKEVEILYS